MWRIFMARNSFGGDVAINLSEITMAREVKNPLLPDCAYNWTELTLRNDFTVIVEIPLSDVVRYLNAQASS